MKPLTFILLLNCLSLSCSEKVILKTVIGIDTEQEVSSEMLLATQNSLEERLNKLGFNKAQISIAPDQKNLLLEDIVEDHKEGDNNRYEVLLADHSLGLWSTYEVTDFENQNLKAKLPYPSDSFIPFPLLPNNYTKEVVAMCTDSNELQATISILEDSLNSLSNLKLLPSKSFSDHYFNGIEGQLIYMINTEGNTVAPLNNQHVTEASASPDLNTGEIAIYFSFNEEGTLLWAEMTKKAALAGNRSIAITINDKVLTVPRVVEAITGGNCQISGAFSLVEATAMAQSLEMNPLPYPVKILSSSTLKQN